MCESAWFLCCVFSVRGFIRFLFNGLKISELVLTCENLCKNSFKPCSKLRCDCLYPPSHIRSLHVFAVLRVTASCSYFYGLRVVLIIHVTFPFYIEFISWHIFSPRLCDCFCFCANPFLKIVWHICHANMFLINLTIVYRLSSIVYRLGFSTCQTRDSIFL